MEKTYQTIRVKIFLAFLWVIFLNGVFFLITLGTFFYFSGSAFLWIAVAFLALIYMALVFYSLIFCDMRASQLSYPLKRFLETLRSGREGLTSLGQIDVNSAELAILKAELEGLAMQVNQFQQFTHQQAAEQNAGFDVILSAIQDMVLILDSSRKVTRISPMLLEILELSKEQVLGHNWIDLPTLSPHYLTLRSLFTVTMKPCQVSLNTSSKMYHLHADSKRIATEDGTLAGTIYILQPMITLRQRDSLSIDIPLEIKKTLLAECVSNWLELLKRSASQYHILLEFVNEIDPNLLIKIDEKKICWALTAFIMNTIYFAKDAIVITVKLTKVDNFLDLTIVDENLIRIVQTENTLFSLNRDGKSTNTPKAIFELTFQLAQEILIAHRGALECYRINQDAFAIQMRLPDSLVVQEPPSTPPTAS
jgi:signal transduction histidine kinase